MPEGISPYPLRELGELLSRLESASAALVSRLSRAVRSLVKLFSMAAPDWPGDVTKERVELLFWVHKAFLLGFIASMVLTSMRG